MDKLLEGIYKAIIGYIDEVQTYRDHLKGLITTARNSGYEDEAIKAYKEEFNRLSIEIQKLNDLASEVIHMH